MERDDFDEQSWIVDHETESHEATFNEAPELQRTLTSTSQVNWIWNKRDYAGKF